MARSTRTKTVIVAEIGPYVSNQAWVECGAPGIAAAAPGTSVPRRRNPERGIKGMLVGANSEAE
jgi:hypothetical protein